MVPRPPLLKCTSSPSGGRPGPSTSAPRGEMFRTRTGRDFPPATIVALRKTFDLVPSRGSPRLRSSACAIYGFASFTGDDLTGQTVEIGLSKHPYRTDLSPFPV